MPNIKVSIIIPVYNVANYLKRCLDSCVNQTLQEIEIIVVNDCSPDPGDSVIMKKYEKNYPDKVRCIWHKENKRQGGARNTGIREARGEFLYFVDSDDYIDLELCEKMYNAIVAENTDMAVCDCNYIDGEIIIRNWTYEGENNGKFDTSDLSKRVNDIKLHNIWLIMIRKSIIANNNLYFPEHTVSDDLVSVLWFLASPKITRLNDALYYYIQRKNSIQHSHNAQTYILVANTLKHIFSLDYFKYLEDNVKKLLFIYLIKYPVLVLPNVSQKFLSELQNVSNNILDILKIYKVNYDDKIYSEFENGILIRDMLCFIELNIDLPDFDLKFLAYWCGYWWRQDKFMQLKKIRGYTSIYPNKRLTIWGCGYFGRQSADNMKLLDIEFKITDANPQTHGQIIADVVVKPWDELKNCTDVVLVSAKGIFEEINARLAKECPKINVVDLVEE